MNWIKAPDTAPGPIRSCSFTLITKFEQCPMRAFLAAGPERIKEPSGAAATRGVEIHQMLEDYTKSVSDALPPKLAADPVAVARMDEARAAYAEGRAEVEDEWAFDQDWNPVPWNDSSRAWLRMKLDELIWESDTSARIRDHKTGKSFGNELKHSDQELFYTVGAFRRYPQLQFVETDMHYVDENKVKLQKRFTRSAAELLFPRVHSRALAVTTAKVFPPKPSKHNCRWCSYKTMQRDDGTPVCPYGVLD